MARLGRRERSALRARKALERAELEAVAMRKSALTDLTPIGGSMSNMWPMGKASVQWGYNGGTAGRIHRAR